VSRLAAQALEQLKAKAGQAYAAITPDARESIRIGLSELLVRLLLLQLEPEHVRPVLGSWVAANSEMLQRLELDRAEIESYFFEGRPSKNLTAIALNLSDRHNAGQTVTILTFQSGLKLVYKPRDTAIEEWYFKTLARLNQIGAPFSFATAKVLCRPAYGWMQFIQHERCRHEDELSEYYQNAGALLCVLHVLGATDCHFQNLIASRQHPVLVDAETLFQPAISESEANSVLRAGMVPQWRFGPQEQAYDVSALGCVTPRPTHFLVPQWQGAAIGFAAGTLVPGENVPFSAGGRFTPRSYMGAMIVGFTQTYRFLARHRQDLIAEVIKAQCLRIRYLLRDTLEYYEAISQLRLPKTERQTLHGLPESRAVFNDLQREELQALAQLDIPRFTLTADSLDLCRLRGCFRQSGFAIAIGLIQRLCEEDLERQASLLRLAWGFSQVADVLQ
jgi:type 2 lantibiotic biosynthesis protein LanM